jgi:predicted transcriptional regulator
MKTAVSVPTDLYQRAERLAHRTGRTRSDVYSAALREYVARHDPDEITDRLDQVVEDVGETPDEERFLGEASLRSLENIEW